MSKTFWNSSHFVRLSQDLFNAQQNPARPNLSPLDVLILARMCSFAQLEKPGKAVYNYESLEVWASITGAGVDAVRRSFRRLQALKLLLVSEMRAGGQTLHLRDVRPDNVHEFCNPKRFLEGWPVSMPTIDQDGKRNYEKTEFLWINADTPKSAWAAAMTKPSKPSPEDVREFILQRPGSVGTRVLKYCAKYCGLDAKEFVDQHPTVQKARKESAEQYEAKAREFEAQKQKRAKTTEKVLNAMRAYQNAQRGDKKQLPFGVRPLSEQQLQAEAGNCWAHYDAEGWQLGKGKRVSDVAEVAGPWLERVYFKLMTSKLENRERQRAALDWEDDLKADVRRHWYGQEPQPAPPETLDVEHEEI